jgi:fatty-acyl-CoA synthase
LLEPCGDMDVAAEPVHGCTLFGVFQQDGAPPVLPAYVPEPDHSQPDNSFLREQTSRMSETKKADILSYWPAEHTIALLDWTLGDALRSAAQRYPGHAALAWADGDTIVSMTYPQMLREAEQIAFWLLQHASEGDRICVWSRNTTEWALLECGIALAGMVVAAWNPGWSDVECEHARNLSEPALILAGADTRGTVLLQRAQQLSAGIPVFDLGKLRELAATAAPRTLPTPHPDDLLLIQFTSGTTGRAKGAMLSHRTVVNSALLRTTMTGADETEVWVNPSPLNHVGGAVSMLPGAIVTGTLYVVMERFDAGEYLRLMKLFGATRIGGVPTMLLAMLEHPDWVPGIAPVRSIGAGGSQVPQPLIERLMREFNAPVLVTFGQSEFPVMTLSKPGEDPRLLAETVGRVAPTVEMKIIDIATGDTLPLGEKGEICVRGPLGMQGYYRAPEATAKTIEADGFLHTGDLGTLDDRGYVRVLGRIRDVIIRGGENIYPAEVEDALLSHPAVASVAVVGVPDEKWGQQVGAAVRLREGCAAPGPEEFEEYLAQRLAHFKRPRNWKFVDAFPMTPNGKISKVEVEKLFVE